MIFIKTTSPLLLMISLQRIIMQSLEVYIKNLNLYQRISTDNKKLRDCMRVACFLSGLPPTLTQWRRIFCTVRNFHLQAKYLVDLDKPPYLSLILFYYPLRNTLFLLVWEGGRFSRCGLWKSWLWRSRRRGSHDRGYDPHKCTYCQGESNIVDFYWIFVGICIVNHSAHQVGLQEEKTYFTSNYTETSIVSIPEEK